ncbi:unnamed protein product [Symbiodinium sp. CCMP2456]|nr:unnamed protein product [Symbiodinium sp. CCMP2456]
MPVTATSQLGRARRLVVLQVLGLSFSLVLTTFALPAAFFFYWRYTRAIGDARVYMFEWMLDFTGVFETENAGVFEAGDEALASVAVFVQAADILGNAVAVLLLSGSHRLLAEDQQKGCCIGSTDDRRAALAEETEWTPAWKAKVEELSLRGMTLRSLLQFYQENLPTMPDWTYAPAEHKTRDVVRRAIIPLTSKEESAYAASALNGDGPQRAQVMVTHNWGNCFKDLLAAVVSDALQECSFNLATNLLEDDPAFLYEILAKTACLDHTYWICSFAVNQHICICHSNPYDRDPFTRELHPVCTCSSANIFDPDGRSTLSEINKFDDMMYHLSATGDCRQVIAADKALDLFNRAWCVAEIAEAKRLQMTQALKFASKAAIMPRMHTLENLDVRSMRASSETDKEFILNKIAHNTGVEQFNTELQSLILDPKSGLLASWHAMDSWQQIREVGRLIRWGLADGGTGKVWKAWEAHE